MVQLIPGFHVGGLSEANELFLPVKGPENASKDGSEKASPDSVEKVNTAVLTVCQDVPYWCSRHHSPRNYSINIRDEAILNLYRTHASNAYVNLHFDLVKPNPEATNPVVSGSGTMYIVHSIIEADDKPDERFYRAFDFSYEFIDHLLSLENGLVFVHCLLGMCRSTSLCCSYLMRKWQRPFLDVKRYIKSVHPRTAISHYFEYQMILFHKNGFKIEDESLFFNYYTRTLDNYLRNRHTLKLEAEVDPKFVYSCKICRENLFSDCNIIGHGTQGGRVPDACNSIFIEPMTWMRGLESQNGKLFCSNDKCNSKLGSFSWHGRKCSCGHLQVPAFQVQMSKVDRFDYMNGSVPSKDANLQVK